MEKAIAVYIAYAESAPSSNPTMTESKKYSGIGKAVIAFGIAMSVNFGFGGTVFFEAKTTELARHYQRDFGAMPLPSFGGPQRFIVDGEVARNISNDYQPQGAAIGMGTLSTFTPAFSDGSSASVSVQEILEKFPYDLAGNPRVVGGKVDAGCYQTR